MKRLFSGSKNKNNNNNKNDSKSNTDANVDSQSFLAAPPRGIFKRNVTNGSTPESNRSRSNSRSVSLGQRLTSGDSSPNVPQFVTDQKQLSNNDNGDLSPELIPIVTLLSSQAHRRYHRGVILVLHDLKNDGTPADRVWKEYFAIILGTQLALWDARELSDVHQINDNNSYSYNNNNNNNKSSSSNNAYSNTPRTPNNNTFDSTEKLKRLASKPHYINFSDATLRPLNSNDLNVNDNVLSNHLDNVLVVSTTLKNRYFLQFSDNNSFNEWTAAIRLTLYENVSLQEAYTGAFLSSRGSKLGDIKNILSSNNKFSYSEWVSVRFGAGMPWKRCYAVIQQSNNTNSNKKSKSKFGVINFYENDKKVNRKSIMASITNAKACYAVYPSSPLLIDNSTIIKLEGNITFSPADEKKSSKDKKNKNGIDTNESRKGDDDYSIFIMAEKHMGVPSYDTIIRFLIPAMNAFRLYGRPEHLIANRNDPNSLMFGLPTLPSIHYLQIRDIQNLIKNNDTKLWDHDDWNDNIDQLLKVKINEEDYTGCGNKAKAPTIFASPSVSPDELYKGSNITSSNSVFNQVSAPNLLSSNSQIDNSDRDLVNNISPNDLSVTEDNTDQLKNIIESSRTPSRAGSVNINRVPLTNRNSDGTIDFNANSTIPMDNHISLQYNNDDSVIDDVDEFNGKDVSMPRDNSFPLGLQNEFDKDYFLPEENTSHLDDSYRISNKDESFPITNNFINEEPILRDAPLSADVSHDNYTNIKISKDIDGNHVTSQTVSVTQSLTNPPNKYESSYEKYVGTSAEKKKFEISNIRDSKIYRDDDEEESDFASAHSETLSYERGEYDDDNIPVKREEFNEFVGKLESVEINDSKPYPDSDTNLSNTEEEEVKAFNDISELDPTTDLASDIHLDSTSVMNGGTNHNTSTYADDDDDDVFDPDYDEQNQLYGAQDTFSSKDKVKELEQGNRNKQNSIPHTASGLNLDQFTNTNANSSKMKSNLLVSQQSSINNNMNPTQNIYQVQNIRIPNQMQNHVANQGPIQGPNQGPNQVPSQLHKPGNPSNQAFGNKPVNTTLNRGLPVSNVGIPHAQFAQQNQHYQSPSHSPINSQFPRGFPQQGQQRGQFHQPGFHNNQQQQNHIARQQISPQHMGQRPQVPQQSQQRQYNMMSGNNMIPGNNMNPQANHPPTIQQNKYMQQPMSQQFQQPQRMNFPYKKGTNSGSNSSLNKQNIQNSLGRPSGGFSQFMPPSKPNVNPYSK